MWIGVDVNCILRKFNLSVKLEFQISKVAEYAFGKIEYLFLNRWKCYAFQCSQWDHLAEHAGFSQCKTVQTKLYTDRSAL